MEIKYPQNNFRCCCYIHNRDRREFDLEKNKKQKAQAERNMNGQKSNLD